MTYNLIKEILESTKSPLLVKPTNKFKKGAKKYKNDKRVDGTLKQFIKLKRNHKEIPIEFNDHKLSNDGKLKGQRSAHIKGQKVVLLYSISGNTLELLGLGTHTDIGTS